MVENITKKLTSNISEKDLLDLRLIDKQIIGTIITIIAYIILIKSASLDKQIILQQQSGENNGSILGDPDKLAAIASFLVLVGSIILTNVAFSRLDEKQQEIQSGKTTDSLEPDINISTGYAISLIANSLKALGAFQRTSGLTPKIIIV